MAMSAPYPATLTFNPPEKVANWRPLVHWLLAIPHFVVLYVLNIVSQVVAFISWFVILFTGALPEGLANLQVLYMRYSARASSYAAFMREEYPPFTFDMTPTDPGDDPRIRVDVVPQLTERNRLTVAFRLILAIPLFLMLFVLGIAAFVVIVIAFFAVLFTGRWPAGLLDFVVKVMRFNTRFQAYFCLLSDVYPPFNLD